MKEAAPAENRRTIRVVYPLEQGEMVLRTGDDWSRDIEPTAVDAESGHFDFELRSPRTALDFKPCIRRGDRLDWAQGTNKLAFLAGHGIQEVYPYFYSGLHGEVTVPQIHTATALDHPLQAQLYLPPGYRENVLKRFPVLYMHDGRNLFFPGDSFVARDWQLDETLDRLDAMNLIDQTIVVGLHSDERQSDYARPGYEAYGRALVEELKPTLDAAYRTLSGPRQTMVMGSSLGGLVSFYLAWQWPEVFANAACLSTSFWYENDLLERVRGEGRQGREGLKIYLDSGWPGDNYEVTLEMADALLEAGFALGCDLQYFVFPNASHHEAAWSARSHLPLQLFSGKLARRAYPG